MSEDNIFNSITIDGTEYRLRFPGLIQISIKKTAGKELFNQPGKAVLLEELLQHLGDPEIQSYLLWQGIKGAMPEKRDMKFEEAVELRDSFLLGSELDSGERHDELCEVLAMAVSAARGADGKKLKEKMEKERLKEKAEKEKTLMDLIDARIELHGIGTKPQSSA
jgi:hypothetical protein